MSVAGFGACGATWIFFLRDGSSGQVDAEASPGLKMGMPKPPRS